MRRIGPAFAPVMLFAPFLLAPGCAVAPGPRLATHDGAASALVFASGAAASAQSEADTPSSDLTEDAFAPGDQEPEAGDAGRDAAPASGADAGTPDDDRGSLSGYLRDRGFDLLDVASVRLSLGPGLLAHARVTRWVALGIGELGPVTNWEQGFFVPLYGIGWLRREGGTWTERRDELGISTFYHLKSVGTPLAGNRETFGADARGAYDVGAELHLALIGLAAEVRPDELLDFVAGLFALDPALDDGPARPRPLRR